MLALGALCDERVVELSLLPELNELIAGSQKSDIRMMSTGVLENIGIPAQESIPLLIRVCFNDSSEAVQESSASAISQIVYEESDISFIPDLINGLTNHNLYYVRASFAVALGKYRTNARSSIPTLMLRLEQDSNQRVRGNIAYAIQVISEEDFSNYPNEPYRETGFEIEPETGELFIVFDAKNWWASEGQFLNWDDETDN
jgi:HEAT repeat protein